MSRLTSSHLISQVVLIRITSLPYKTTHIYARRYILQRFCHDALKFCVEFICSFFEEHIASLVKRRRQLIRVFNLTAVSSL